MSKGCNGCDEHNVHIMGINSLILLKTITALVAERVVLLPLQFAHLIIGFLPLQPLALDILVLLHHPLDPPPCIMIITLAPSLHLLHHVDHRICYSFHFLVLLNLCIALLQQLLHFRLLLLHLIKFYLQDVDLLEHFRLLSYGVLLYTLAFKFLLCQLLLQLMNVLLRVTWLLVGLFLFRYRVRSSGNHLLELARVAVLPVVTGSAYFI